MNDKEINEELFLKKINVLHHKMQEIINDVDNRYRYDLGMLQPLLTEYGMTWYHYGAYMESLKHTEQYMKNFEKHIDKLAKYIGEYDDRQCIIHAINDICPFAYTDITCEECAKRWLLEEVKE